MTEGALSGPVVNGGLSRFALPVPAWRSQCSLTIDTPDHGTELSRCDSPAFQKKKYKQLPIFFPEFPLALTEY
jgi:hypothetical protein